MPWAMKTLNPLEVYAINSIEIKMIGRHVMAANRKGEPAYENRFRNRPISGGRDLSCVRFERLPELHSTAAAGGHRWAIHGCPVCLTLSVGDLRFPGHRRRTSAGQPLRAVGGGRAGAGDRQHSCFPRLDGPERASSGPLRGCTVGGDLRRRTTGVCRVVPVALAVTGLINWIVSRHCK